MQLRLFRTGSRFVQKPVPASTMVILAITAVVFLGGCDELFPKRSVGEKLYRKRCASCHGLDARGNTILQMGNHVADLTDETWKYGGDGGSITETIRNGIFAQMPANEDLSGEQIREIRKHLKKLRTNARKGRS